MQEINGKKYFRLDTIISLAITMIFIFFGLVFFSLPEMKAEAERIEQLEKERIIDDKNNSKIQKVFENTRMDYLKEFSFVYQTEIELAYKYDVDNDYIKKIQSPDWKGTFDNKLTLHIKQEWNNSVQQKKELLQLIRAMEEQSVVDATVIYNRTTNLYDVKSQWFKFASSKSVKPKTTSLSDLQQLKTVKDIDKLNAIYSGYLEGEYKVVKLNEK